MDESHLDELRMRWSKAWGKQPHGTMGRKMLEKSLHFKLRETETGGLKKEHMEQLNKLINSYKRSPSNFNKTAYLKPGTRLLRKWKGAKYYVTVTQDGFEYEGTVYKSLSNIANIITGSRWNGWVFFGLK